MDLIFYQKTTLNVLFIFYYGLIEPHYKTDLHLELERLRQNRARYVVSFWLMNKSMNKVYSSGH